MDPLPRFGSVKPVRLTWAGYWARAPDPAVANDQATHFKKAAASFLDQLIPCVVPAPAPEHHLMLLWFFPCCNRRTPRFSVPPYLPLQLLCAASLTLGVFVINLLLFT